jgi:hypothetical protein
MPIVALLQEAAFNPETTHILVTAFDKAWDKFKSSGNALADDACAPSTRALLAKRIIETAQRGERNVDRLVENGVEHRRRSERLPIFGALAIFATTVAIDSVNK